MFIYHSRMIVQKLINDNFNLVLAPGFEPITSKVHLLAGKLPFLQDLNFSDQ